MRLEVNSKTNIEIRHRFNTMEIEIEDADYSLVDSVVRGLLDEYGMDKIIQTLCWEEEDIKVLFECFEEEFKSLGLLDKG